MGPVRYLLAFLLVCLSTPACPARGGTGPATEASASVCPRILSERDIGDILRGIPILEVSGERLYGRGSVGAFEGIRGNSLKILCDGIEISGKDYRGAMAVPVEMIDSIYVDPYRPALKLKSWVSRDERPYTWVRTLIGSRALNITSAGFSRRIGRKLRVSLSGHRGSVKDRLASKGFDDDAFFARLDGGSSRGLKLTASAFGYKLSKEIPYAPGRKGQPDGLPRRIRDWRRCASVGASLSPRNALDLSARVWVDLLNRKLGGGDITPAEREDFVYGLSFGTSLGTVEACKAAVEVSYKSGSFDTSVEPRTRWRLYGFSSELTLRIARGLALRGWFAGKRHSSFGYGSDFGAAVYLDGSDGFRFSLGGSRFVRYPTFDEVGWQGYEWADPVMRVGLNPESYLLLRSEVKLNLSEWLSLAISGFVGKVDDLIDFVADPGGVSYSNIAKAEFAGSDIILALSPAPWAEVELTLNLISGKDARSGGSLYHLPASDLRGSVLLKRSLFKKKLKLTTHLLWELPGRSYGYDASSGRVVDLGGTALVDLRFGLQFMRDFYAFYKIDNLLDSGYQPEFGRTVQGRSYLWGIRWNFWD